VDRREGGGKMNLRIANLLALTLCMSLLSGAGQAQKDKVQTRMEEIKTTIAKVRSGQTRDARTDEASHLADLVKKLSKKEISEPLVVEITSLLDCPDDSVQYYVAMALGNIGRPAKSAIPRLEKMLPAADCMDGVATSANGIRYALERMGVKPPPRPGCMPRAA
jgi:hypothetical protein